MSTPVPEIDFFGPWLKVERAEQHIRNLEEIFGQHIAAEVKRVRPKRHGYVRKKTASFGGKLPKHTATVLGDAIHNLRAALDHAYCILIEANGGKVLRQSYFPFGEDRQSVKGIIGGHEKAGAAPAPKIQALIIDEIEPFQGGGLDLYGLHRLDITDKHRVLIPTAIMLIMDDMKVMQRGKVINRVQGITLLVPHTEKRTDGALAFEDGAYPVFDRNPKKALHICFGEEQPFQNEAVLEVLKRLTDGVKAALTILHLGRATSVI